MPTVILFKKNNAMLFMNTTTAAPIGPHIVNVKDQLPYFVPLKVGALYSWSVTGGNIKFGQGTNQIIVEWTESGEGSVNIIVNHRGTKPQPTGITVIIEPE
jgi:hypothetical protein